MKNEKTKLMSQRFKTISLLSMMKPSGEYYYSMILGTNNAATCATFL